MELYKILNKQNFSFKNYTIVPIRSQDRYLIMKWRNEQIYHLRQSEVLTSEVQDNYFKTVIKESYTEESPSQILFSLLKSEKCIGYGGLVHINWIDKNAEISFIMETKLEEKNFDLLWSVFLSMIETVAFDTLKLSKIYVYAFDIRINLYRVLEDSNYFFDARLKKHVWYNDRFIDVVIYSKFKE